MTPANRVAAAVAAVGLLSSLIVWLVVPQTRVVFAVAPALLMALLTVLIAGTALAFGRLARGRARLQALGDQRVAMAAQEVESRLGAERGRLLGRIDHELKNPVMATNLALDALRAAPPGSPQATDAVEVIATQSARLGALLTSLRKIADVEHRDLDIEPVDLGELLTAVRDACSTTPSGRQRQWSLNLPQAPWPLPAIAGDPDLLYLALYNLTDNAVKYSRPGDRIEIRAAESEGGIGIVVADTGAGIPAEEVPDVFDELSRASTARGIPGQGLGLALVRSVAGRHGGRVHLDSRIGVGTSVSLWLPVRPPTQNPERKA
ncbi:MAG: HAMP domain-containing sensor histidine kinase [Micropruina sp.]|uniref:sensor histidine kinase n=1 Tax=Micropruina sp. TaxID=2737536 RepID=UPI0039E5E0E3